MPLEHAVLGVAVVLLALTAINLGLLAANLKMAKQNSAHLDQIAELHALIAGSKNPKSQGGDIG